MLKNFFSQDNVNRSSFKHLFSNLSQTPNIKLLLEIVCLNSFNYYLQLDQSRIYEEDNLVSRAYYVGGSKSCYTICCMIFEINISLQKGYFFITVQCKAKMKTEILSAQMT